MAERQEIFASLKEHLLERGHEPEVITLEAELGRDVGLDSLDTMELTVALEEKWDIEMPDDEIEQLRTVRDAVELIERKTSASV
jgi:acyl carrier protein